jgi:hypothetical protein
MALEDNKAVSMKFMQCFDRRDLDGCRALLARVALHGRGPPLDGTRPLSTT